MIKGMNNILLFVGVVGIFLIINRMLGHYIQEQFHSGVIPYIKHKLKDVWWGYREIPGQLTQGDPVLTNFYRKVHNMDKFNRIDVMEHSHIQTPGGGLGINRQIFIAEAVDREMKKKQKKINDYISSHRKPYSDNNIISPIGGEFDTCFFGDCSQKYNEQGKILGIPSVPGTRHTYY